VDGVAATGPSGYAEIAFVGGLSADDVSAIERAADAYLAG
jgi:hypothetical protein